MWPEHETGDKELAVRVYLLMSFGGCARVNSHKQNKIFFECTKLHLLISRVSLWHTVLGSLDSCRRPRHISQDQNVA